MQSGVRVAIFSPQLNPVGTEHVMLSLAKGFAKHGYRVDLLRTGTEWKDQTSELNLKVYDIGFNWIVKFLPRHGILFRVSIALLMVLAFPGLVRYIRREKPAILMPGLVPAVALLAAMTAPGNTGVVISVQGWPYGTPLRRFLWRHLYARAVGIVAPSRGVAEAVSEIAGVDHAKVALIPNPVIDDSIFEKAKEPVEDSEFFSQSDYLVMGAGRLTAQKDFSTLIRAFARVRESMDASLLILGEGEERQALESLVCELGLDAHVYMPGYVANPFKYMAKASVFALSSRWEGPGHVVIEALALGVPVVSTDCPSGPREILMDGKAGLLVPMGDSEALSDAILDALRNPHEARARTDLGQTSVANFRSDNVVARYVDLLESLQHSREGLQVRAQ